MCACANCPKKVLLCAECLYEDAEHVKAHKDQIIPVAEFLLQVEQHQNNANNNNINNRPPGTEGGPLMSLHEMSQEIYNLAIYSEYHQSEFAKYISHEKNKLASDIAALEGLF